MAVLEYARSNARIRSHFLPPNIAPEREEDILAFGAIGLVTSLIDRLIQIFGSAEVTPSDVRGIYVELEAPVLEESLDVEIVVPVALTKFATAGAWSLGGAAFIEEMDDATHLARYPRDSLWLPAHGIVVSAATHALVLGGYEMRSQNIWERHRLNFRSTQWTSSIASLPR
ncbi:MAG TPA: hypothetical protein VKA30_08965 [Actinomycetota bacterium]|nr:hypothetical protein [Actinomycetota bacterium]